MATKKKTKSKPVTPPTLTVQMGGKNEEIYDAIKSRSEVLGIDTTVYHRTILEDEFKHAEVFNRLKKAFNKN